MSRGTNPSNPDNVTPDGDEDILQDEELTEEDDEFTEMEEEDD